MSLISGCTILKSKDKLKKFYSDILDDSNLSLAKLNLIGDVTTIIDNFNKLSDEDLEMVSKISRIAENL